MPFVNTVFNDIEGNTSSLGYGLLDLANEAATQILITALTLGTVKGRTLISNRIQGTTVLPASNYAMAGNKLRIHWQDDVTEDTGFYSIPTIDAADLEIVGKEVSMTSPQPVVDLVADINLNWSSPKNNPITVTRLELVTVNR